MKLRHDARFQISTDEENRGMRSFDFAVCGIQRFFLFLRLRTGMYTEYTDTEQNLIYHTGLYVRIYFQMQNYFFHDAAQ